MFEQHSSGYQGYTGRDLTEDDCFLEVALNEVVDIRRRAYPRCCLKRVECILVEAPIEILCGEESNVFAINNWHNLESTYCIVA